MTRKTSLKLLSRSWLTSLAAISALGLAPKQAHAFEPGRFKLGALGGQVGLMGDPGSNGANALGFGVLGGFQLDESLALNIQYTTSSHSRVDHHDISVGGDYYLGDYTNAYPHLTAGMSFITNKFKDGDVSGNAAAIYVGGGLDFELRRDLTLGPQLRYQKAFEASGKLNNQDVKTVQDSYTLMIRLIYLMGTDD